MLGPLEQLTLGATIVAHAKPACTPLILLKQRHKNTDEYYKTIQWGAYIDLKPTKAYDKGNIIFLYPIRGSELGGNAGRSRGIGVTYISY